MTIISPSVSVNDLLCREPRLLLKWKDTVVGEIDADFSVKFVSTDFNAVVISTVGQAERWTREQFRLFLEDRIVSSSRRDIATILARLSLQEYDCFSIAKRTRAFNLKDAFWISYSENEEYETTFVSVFKEMFSNIGTPAGDVISSPDGQNVKYYAMRDGRVGIVKKQLHPKSYDAVNEVVAYRLSQLLFENCCPAYVVNDSSIFSEYCYDFNSQFLVHARRLTGAVLDANTYFDFVNEYFPKYKTEIQNMLVFDFILNQDDRHMSNWGVLYNEQDAEEMYPLYDNGRCLFHDASDETLSHMQDSPSQFVSSLGLVGTYLDVVDIIKESRKFKIHLTDDELLSCFGGLPLYTDESIKARLHWLKFAIAYLTK